MLFFTPFLFLKAIYVMIKCCLGKAERKSLIYIDLQRIDTFGTSVGFVTLHFVTVGSSSGFGHMCFSPSPRPPPLLPASPPRVKIK